jgi:peptidoglycan-associated lipoprotein
MVLGLFVAACSSTGDNAGGAAGSGTGSTSAAPGTQAHLEQETSNDRVFFGFDEYALTPDARNQVQRWASWMLSNPNVNVLIEGHADERGTRDYNLALGARRSHAVKVALESLGVSGNRIETTTFGKERPAVAGSNESAWAQNRRAVIVVKGGASS